jgi:hypothetical protein
MADLSGTFRLQPPDVTAENFDGEYVILNLATGRYFALSPTGSVLLEGILAGFNLTDIAEVFAGGDERRARQARALVREMLDHRLLEAGADPAVPPSPGWAERARNADGPIVLEVYDDIADLITADPIHDTEEAAGWPVRKGGDGLAP